MNTHSAVITLRRASKLMRERAHAATPGPWVSLDGGDRLIHDPGHDLDPPVYVVDEPMSNAANAEHIAAMHPGVALALAGWLDAEADAHQACAVLAATAESGELAVGGTPVRIEVGLSTLGDALAVAVAYLNEHPGDPA